MGSLNFLDTDLSLQTCVRSKHMIAGLGLVRNSEQVQQSENRLPLTAKIQYNRLCRSRAADFVVEVVYGSTHKDSACAWP